MKRTNVKLPKSWRAWLAAIFLMGSVGCGSDPAQRSLQQGADCYAKEDFSLAQEHYSQAITLKPGSADAYLGRGKSRERLTSPAAAIDDYQRALELQPDLFEAKERLILVLVDSGSGQKALDQLATMQPHELTPVLLLARGRARLQIESASEAIADFDQVIQLEPKNASALFYRGLTYAKVGRLPDAEQDFTSAITLDPKHASAFWQRSLVREKQGNKELAASDRKKAVDLDPRMGFADSQFGKKMMENLTGKEGDSSIELFSKERR